MFKHFLFFHFQRCQAPGMMMNAQKCVMKRIYEKKKRLFLGLLGKEEKRSVWCMMCFQTRTRNQECIFLSNARYEITLRKGRNSDSHNTSSVKNTVIKRDAEHLHHLLGLFAEAATKPQSPLLSEQPAMLTSYSHVKHFSWCFYFSKRSPTPACKCFITAVRFLS